MNQIMPADPLTREQRARAEALHTAAAVAAAAPEPSTSFVATSNLVDLAAYVMDGVHPLTRYDDDAEPVEARTLSGQPTGADQ